jgi:hypothetical protein
MDGGSRVIFLRDAAGAEHTLSVPQHHIPTNFTPEEPPGALIFDGEVLDVRGPAEQELVATLQNATYAPASRRKAIPHGRLAPPERRITLGEDVSATLAAIDRGAESALRHAVASVLEFVGSEEYVDVARRFHRVK